MVASEYCDWCTKRASSEAVFVLDLMSAFSEMTVIIEIN